MEKLTMLDDLAQTTIYEAAYIIARVGVKAVLVIAWALITIGAFIEVAVLIGFVPND